MRSAWPLGLALTILAGCSEAPTVPQVHPLPEGRLSSDYGVRTVDPLSGEATPNGHHDGYDLAAAMDTPIRAAKAGKVTFAGRQGGYGKVVILAHPGGWSTLYGHAGRLAVKAGQEVSAGEIVAYVGSTGRSTGPHLHYELRLHGKPVDPGLFAAAMPMKRTVAPRPATPRVTASRSPAPRVAQPPPTDVAPLQDPVDASLLSTRQAIAAASRASAPLAPVHEPQTRWERLKRLAGRFFQRMSALLSV